MANLLTSSVRSRNILLLTFIMF